MTMLQVPVHPGEILKEEYLVPLGLSEGQLAKRIGVPRTRLERVTRGETGVTIDTAARLARALGTTPQFWLNLQMAYDLRTAVPEIDVSGIEPVTAA